jgi:hypothetical protein
MAAVVDFAGNGGTALYLNVEGHTVTLSYGDAVMRVPV